MAHDIVTPAVPPAPAEDVADYDEFNRATPQEKTERVLALIAANGGRLDLPVRAGEAANLMRIDLSREALKARLAELGVATAPWWQARLQGANLARARLPEAHLAQARLQGAVLTSADLRGANLIGADLQGARLTEANLEGAELTGANLQGAGLVHANLRHADLTSAKLQGADLGKADLFEAELFAANLQGAKMLGTQLRGAKLHAVNLREALLRETDFRDAVLNGAKLQKADLYEAQLQGAALRGAHLQEATLQGANLQGADLRGAHLEGVDLLVCADIRQIRVQGAWLERTRLRREQLGEVTGDELAARAPQADASARADLYQEAKLGYLALKQNFDGLGDYEAASWAYRRERRMRKHQAQYMALAAWRARQRREALRHAGKFCTDWGQELVCDYGESFWRVAGCVILICAAFTLGYGAASGVLRGDLATGQVTRQPLDWLLFSLGAMTTMGAEGLNPAGVGTQVAVRLEALLTISLIGLLGFVVGNRIRRS